MTGEAMNGKATAPSVGNETSVSGGSVTPPVNITCSGGITLPKLAGGVPDGE